MGGFLLAEKERCAMYRSPSIAHRNAMLAPPKHSRLAPSREILLVLSLAFARLFCHRQRSQRSLSREFESFSAIKKHRKSGAFLLAEKERYAMYRSPSIAHRSAMLAPPKHSRLAPSAKFSLFCHSLLLACSATGSARNAPSRESANLSVQ